MVKTINKIKGVNAKQIAEVLEISYRSVLNKLQGKTSFTVNEMEEIYNNFGIEYWELKQVVEINQLILQANKEEIDEIQY